MKVMDNIMDESQAHATGPRLRSGIAIPILDGRYEGIFHGFDGLIDVKEHIAIRLGDPDSADVPLVRLHSECLTGDVFGSMKCDCGAQLIEALQRIHEHGGFLLYLRQEGRGIGLYNKFDAYRLQAAGMNTFEANRALGFGDDMRDYEVAAQMLKALGHSRISLLSNNPEKVRQLEAHGIEVVDRVGTGIHCNEHNHSYLASKAASGGHHINMEDLKK